VALRERESWFLINASPDLTWQIENSRGLHPRMASSRNTPVAAVLLTNADLDHVLGLFLLRQQDQPLVVYASESVKVALQWLEKELEHFCGIEWRTDPTGALDVTLSYRALEVAHSRAFQVRNSSGKSVLFALSVEQLNQELIRTLDQSEIVFFDGTFWSDNELGEFRPSARSAREMHHLPISQGSLEALRQCAAARKIYMHINNTNPILMPDSRERREVEDAGIEVGYDGLELEL
jgi:pyrroloquinoline quinone biosynthesis protein B